VRDKLQHKKKRNLVCRRANQEERVELARKTTQYQLLEKNKTKRDILIGIPNKTFYQL